MAKGKGDVMALFGVWFSEDVTPLLIDGCDEPHARAIASEVHEGAVISRTVALPPGAFVAELFAEDEDGDEVVVEPLDHVVDYLETLDAIDVDVLDVVAARCGSEAEGDDGEVLACELGPHDVSQQHEATTAAGELRMWSDG